MTDFYAFSPTFRLFAVPTFMEGITMALDVAHTMPQYNNNSNSAMADALALASDWRAVGRDIDDSTSSFAPEKAP